MSKDLTKNPFDEFKIDSHAPLKCLVRSICPKCKASRMYFCYTCFCYVEGIEKNLLPKVKLPVPVDIIKHPKELDGKSTAVHAALLACEDVCVYTFPMFPNYASENINAILVFPGPNAKSMDELSRNESAQKLPETDFSCEAPSSKRIRSDESASKSDTESISDVLSSTQGFKPTPTFQRIVMIDSTWNQVHSISTDPRLQGLPRIELKERTTLYWRRQHNSPNTFLSTIEALYCFVKQYHELFIGSYENEYDNLLYFFKFFYDMVYKNKASRKN